MAIAYDNAVDGGYSATVPQTTSFTVGTGNNRYLIVGVLLISASDLVTGVTYAGVAMTRLKAAISGVGEYMYLYGLANPASGANDIVVSASGAGGGIETGAISYTGVGQTGQPDSSNSGTVPGGSTSLSATTTTVADNSWLVMISRSSTNQSASTNTTFRTTLGGSTQVEMSDSNSDQTPPGSKSLNTTFASSAGGWVIVSISPPSVVSANTSSMLLSF